MRGALPSSTRPCCFREWCLDLEMWPTRAVIKARSKRHPCELRRVYTYQVLGHREEGSAAELAVRSNGRSSLLAAVA